MECRLGNLSYLKLGIYTAGRSHTCNLESKIKNKFYKGQPHSSRGRIHISTRVVICGLRRTYRFHLYTTHLGTPMTSGYIWATTISPRSKNEETDITQKQKSNISITTVLPWPYVDWSETIGFAKKLQPWWKSDWWISDHTRPAQPLKWFYKSPKWYSWLEVSVIIRAVVMILEHSEHRRPADYTVIGIRNREIWAP